MEDIEKVAELIAGRSDMEIKSEKDYIRNMKPSGYRSYHLDRLLYSGDAERSQTSAGRTADPDDGNRFLGDHQTSLSV